MPAAGVSIEDFYSYLPLHQYLFVPDRALWPAASVNARCKPPLDSSGRRAARTVPRNAKGGGTTFEEVALTAAEWLDANRAVEQMTWMPGEPPLIRDRLISPEGGWIERPGAACFNQYRPALPCQGDPGAADPWIEHVHTVYEQDAGHIVMWLAHRVQRPGEKINHALVLGGGPGIGKDTLLTPVRRAVGPWNFVDVSPGHMLGRFNGFVKSVILRISEARDLGDTDRFAFHDHLKIFQASPPEVLRVDEKHLREYCVPNVCGVIITTNHKSDGIYLPADDRRHFVAWSERSEADFSKDYWDRLYGWYAAGGDEHVTAYLRSVPLDGWNPKAPPPKTAAFWAIADANRAPEDAELADVLEALGNRAAVCLHDLKSYATPEFREWLEERRNRRAIPHRLESAGYVPVRNETANDGLWKVGMRRQAIYARATLPLRDRIAAAAQLARRTGDSQ